jgi:hypothetical protein
MSPWDVTGKHKVKNCGEREQRGTIMQMEEIIISTN